MGVFTGIYRKIFGIHEPEPIAAPEGLPAAAATGERRPVIAISGETNSKSVAAMVTQIRSAGAEPVFIGEHAQRIAGGVGAAVERDLSKVDGLVIMGNDNSIDPAKYGKTPKPGTVIEAPERAAYEDAAMQFALDHKIPLVGVCAGMQRLNVIGGGSLNQSVAETVGDGHHDQKLAGIEPFVPVQLVQIDADSKLQGISGSTHGVYTPTRAPLPPNVIMENSFHHEAVERIRDDFRACARSDDGIVEAIEPKKGSKYDDQFVVGVQWHPEFGASDFGPKLASQLTHAAAQYAKTKPEPQQEQQAMMGELPIQGALAQQVLAQRQQQAMHR